IHAQKNLMFTTIDGVNIGSICKVAIRFSNIAHDLLPGQIQAETLQLVQNRIEQIFIYCTK
ncbi:MAG: hypothetical protein ACRC0N_04755, partial [Acinetobacter johnsonii]